MIAERPLERLVIWNRSLERGQALVRELSGAVEARLAENLEPEVRRHRIIVTATSSTMPLIRAAWVQKGTHITSAGTGSIQAQGPKAEGCGMTAHRDTRGAPCVPQPRPGF